MRAFAGGLVVTWTGSVALVYGAVGLLTFAIALLFSFSPLGHAERYLPRGAGLDEASQPATPPI